MGLCPRHPLWMVDRLTGDMTPRRCGSYRCDVCGPHKARGKAALMTWTCRQVGWTRLVTLTQLPILTGPQPRSSDPARQAHAGDLDWDRTRAQIRDLTRRLRLEGHQVEWAWAVERNPRGTGFHAHGIQHGSYIPQRELSELWGNRRVDIRAITRPDAQTYHLKEAMRVTYAVKGSRTPTWRDHLIINGDRAVHFSRGFLLGHTTREVETLLAQGKQERSWMLLPADPTTGEVIWNPVPTPCVQPANTPGGHTPTAITAKP